MSRYGTTAAAAVLGAIAVLALVTTHWLLFILFLFLTGGALFVRGVKRSTGR
jgi:hypothetical protein